MNSESVTRTLQKRIIQVHGASHVTPIRPRRGPIDAWEFDFNLDGSKFRVLVAKYTKEEQDA